MKGTRAAIRYAKAILDLAKDQNSAPAVNDDMKLIINAIADNKELKSLLNSPVVKAAQKTAVLDKLKPYVAKDIFNLPQIQPIPSTVDTTNPK